MFLNLIPHTHIAFTVLVLFFSFIRFSTQKYQLFQKGELYDAYFKKALPDGYTKLSMDEFYKCSYNLDYFRLPEKNSLAKNYSTDKEVWCLKHFKSWKAFRYQLDVSYFRNQINELKYCFLNDNKDYAVILYDCFKTIEFVKNKHVLSKPTVEKSINACLRNQLNTIDKSGFQNCINKFKSNTLFCKEKINISYLTLYAVNDILKDDKKLTEKETMLKSCLGYNMKPHLSECFSKNFSVVNIPTIDNKSEVIQINDCLHVNLLNSEKILMSKCAMEFEAAIKNQRAKYAEKPAEEEVKEKIKVSSRLSWLTDLIKPKKENQEIKGVRFHYDINRIPKQNMKESLEPEIQYNILSVIKSALFKNYRAIDFYENEFEIYTELKPPSATKQELENCYNKMNLKEKQVLATFQDYKKFPDFKENESFNDYTERVNPKTEKNYLPTTIERFDQFKKCDSLKGETYENYLKRFIISSTFMPLIRDLWEEEERADIQAAEHRSTKDILKSKNASRIR